MRRGTTSHIETSPDVCHGRPRIAGTRIRIQDIVAMHEFQGMSTDEIVSGFPHLTLADAYAAMAYYHDHRDEIDRHMREDDDLVKRLREAEHSGRGGDAGARS